jgi:hypothetical protein
MTQHFGLAANARAESVAVRWPDGRKMVFRDVPAGRVVVVGPPAAARAAG